MPRTTITSSSSSTRTSERSTSSIIHLRTPRPEASTSARISQSQRYCAMRRSSNELAPLADPEPDVLSSVSNVIEFPVRHDYDVRLERDLVLALATADDLASGMAGVADRIRRTAGADGVEWWAKGDDGVLDLVDAMLEAARKEPAEPTFSSVATCLDQLVEDLRAEVEITADTETTMPL